MIRMSRLSINKSKFSSSENIRDSLKQMRVEMETNMKEMKDKLDTLTAVAEEKRDGGQWQEKHPNIKEK